MVSDIGVAVLGINKSPKCRQQSRWEDIWRMDGRICKNGKCDTHGQTPEAAIAGSVIAERDVDIVLFQL